MISQAEKLDVLLALALAFEKKSGKAGAANSDHTAAELVERSFSSLEADDLKNLRSRAALFDRLTADKQRIWQGIRLDQIRRRGLPARLDEQVHPLHIVKVLDREPKTVQLLVLRNLPVELSRRIAAHLETKPAEDEFSSVQNSFDQPVNDEIIALIRRKFLSHFVALEDVFEPSDLDKLSMDELAAFIRHLGVRETAIACRGINSKETLAAFLNRFDEENAKEIAQYITDLEKIKPFWVARADRLLRQTLENGFQPETLLRNLGYKLLAMAFTARDETARKYTAQKMLPFEAENFYRFIAESENEYLSASEDERQKLERSRRITERLAGKFINSNRE